MGNRFPASKVAAKAVLQARPPSKAKLPVGLFEVTGAVALQDHVLADAQHDQVPDAVTIDIDRIEAGDLVSGLLRQRGLLIGEAENAARKRAVHVEPGVVGSARHCEVGKTVAIAVERGDAATDEILPGAVIHLLDARGFRLLLHHRHIHRQVVGTPIGRRSGNGEHQRCGQSDCASHGITSVLRKPTRSARSLSGSCRKASRAARPSPP